MKTGSVPFFKTIFTKNGSTSAPFQPWLPDLALLDAVLPDGTGTDLLAELRSNPLTKEMPIIMISAYKTSVQDRIDGLDRGADDYLVKPFHLQELKSRIERLLRRVKQIEKSHPPRSPVQEKQPVYEKSLEASIPPKIEEAPPPAEPNLESVLKKIITSPRSKGEIFKTKPPSVGLPVHSSKVSFKNKLVQLFLDPAAFLAYWKEQIDFFVPLFLAGIYSLGMGLQFGVQEKNFGAGFVGVTVFFSGSLCVVALVAWLVEWGLGLQQRHVPFSHLTYSF